MLLFYFLWCRLCVSSFGSFPVFLFYRPIPAFYAYIPALYTKIHCYVFSTCSTTRGLRAGVGGVGSHGWLGGVPGLVHVFNQLVSLTCQPDYRFRIPVRLPFPQGTGDSSSEDHLWVGPHNRDFDLTVYPPPYLQKGFVHFSLHDSTKLRE